MYRRTMNGLMRLVAQLNASVDHKAQQSELYRVKLQNADLRDKISELLKQKETYGLQGQAEALLSTEFPCGAEAQRCLRHIEEALGVIAQ
jgi:hypothetical protein